MASPITDPAAAGQAREADLTVTQDELAGPNPHAREMNLPPACMDDGAGYGGEQGL
jgi:hypothetical protein